MSAVRWVAPCLALAALACGGKSESGGPRAMDASGASPSSVSSSGSGGNSSNSSGNGGTASASKAGTGGSSEGTAGTPAGGPPLGGGGDTASAGGDGGDGGAAGAAPSTDITAVLPSAGCGMPPPQGNGPFTIATSGTKDPDCADTNNGGVCGAWTYERQYDIYLPANYDNTRPYVLVFETPGCGGNGTTNPTYGQNANNSIIRIGLTPSPEVGKFVAYAPGGGCFDAWEGDDSVDFVFYEKLYDRLSTQLCFDRNRVFVGGNASGGAQIADELGCKYAGDAARPVRGVMPNSGGLLSQPAWQPTCSNHPMAGFWSDQIGNPVQPFTQTKYAIDRAMTVNGCPAGQTYDTASFAPFPIGGANADDVCKRITGCDPRYPLVVCALPGNQHSSNVGVVEPGVSTFLQSFLAPPLAH